MKIIKPTYPLTLIDGRLEDISKESSEIRIPENRFITVWENDPTEDLEPEIEEYWKLNYKRFDIHLLSGLPHRDPVEIIESIDKGCLEVVIKTHVPDMEQITKIVKLLGKGIYGYIYGYDLKRFTFLTNQPEQLAKRIIENCDGPWDDDPYNPRNALIAILERKEAVFFDLHSGEKYSITTTGWYNRRFEIEKWK